MLGAVGVFIGVITADLEWIGLLAGFGLIALMIGAVVYHNRAGDPPKEMAPAVMMMGLSVLYIIALFGNGVPA